MVKNDKNNKNMRRSTLQAPAKTINRDNGLSLCELEFPRAPIIWSKGMICITRMQNSGALMFVRSHSTPSPLFEKAQGSISVSLSKQMTG